MAGARKTEKSPKALRSIGEVASEIGVQTHVLRYWEGKFPKFIKPLKRPDGRRMYRPEDVSVARAIQTLVHFRGMTLKGANNVLCEQGVKAVLDGGIHLIAPAAQPIQTVEHKRPLHTLSDAEMNVKLQTTLARLQDIKTRLDGARAFPVGRRAA